jgi:hypothetical protein
MGIVTEKKLGKVVSIYTVGQNAIIIPTRCKFYAEIATGQSTFSESVSIKNTFNPNWYANVNTKTKGIGKPSAERKSFLPGLKAAGFPNLIL